MLTTTQTDLFQAILDDPADDTRRLVYADWLEEHGDGERAEFIRLQIRIAELVARGCHEGQTCNVTGPCAECGREVEVFGLRRRERELLGANAVQWSHAARCIVGGNDLGWNGANIGMRSADRERRETWMAFRRGFVAEVRCRLADWMQHGPEIVKTTPIERVVMTDRRPEFVAEDNEAWWWALTDEEAAEDHEVAAHWIPEGIAKHFKQPHNEDGSAHVYPSTEAAETELSAASILWAKSPTPLPTFPPPPRAPRRPSVPPPHPVL